MVSVFTPKKDQKTAFSTQKQTLFHFLLNFLNSKPKAINSKIIIPLDFCCKNTTMARSYVNKMG